MVLERGILDVTQTTREQLLLISGQSGPLIDIPRIPGTL